MNRTTLSGLFLAAFCLFTSCGVRQEFHFTRERPKESDLFGVYAPDTKTRKLILEDGRYLSDDCKIKISPDGRIEFIGWQARMGNTNPTNASWRLYFDPSGKHWLLAWEHDNTVDLGFNLIGQKPPYKIHIYVGDPDSDRFMIFERLTN